MFPLFIEQVLCMDANHVVQIYEHDLIWEYPIFKYLNCKQFNLQQIAIIKRTD